MSEFKKASARGWTSDVIRCVDLIETREFELSDCYKFENRLRELHPDNQNVKPKIRQQLQIMRDRSLLEFLGNGRYRKK
jgi:type II restriction enzyme